MDLHYILVVTDTLICGTDVFKSRANKDTWTGWSTPVNLGKYVNTYIMMKVIK